MSKNKAVKKFIHLMPIAIYGSRNYKLLEEAETEYRNQKNFRNLIKYKNKKRRE